MVLIDKIFLTTSLLLMLIGALLLRYSDNHKVTISPKYMINKLASYLIKDVDHDLIRTHENSYFPHNKKMGRISILAIVILIIGTLLGIIAVF